MAHNTKSKNMNPYSSQRILQKGINKATLLSKISNLLNRKEEEDAIYEEIREEYKRDKTIKEEYERQKEKKERVESDLFHLFGDILTILIERDDNIVPTEAEEILTQNNKDLYLFLLPVIDKVPSIRQEKYADFEENPWNLVLDELNAMNELVYRILNVLVNENEPSVTHAIMEKRTELSSFFQNYPILSYAIVTKRLAEESWMINTIVFSKAYLTYPHSEILKTLKRKDLHPFSRFFLAENIKEINAAIDDFYKYMRKYVREKGTQVYDPILYLFFLRLLEDSIENNEKIEIDPNSILDGFFKYFIAPHSSDVRQPPYVPLNNDILFTYFSIYEKTRYQKLVSHIVNIVGKPYETSIIKTFQYLHAMAKGLNKMYTIETFPGDIPNKHRKLLMEISTSYDPEEYLQEYPAI